MILFLLTALGSAGTRRPITDYVQSHGSCKLCKSISLIATKFGNEGISMATALASLEQYCSLIPNKNAKTMCNMILTDEFENIWEMNENFCSTSAYCHEGSENIAPCKRLLKIADSGSVHRPVAKPLGILDCDICEMIVGFCLENVPSISSSTAADLIRKDCAVIPEFKKHCKILTDEMVSNLLDFLASNLHASEICSFYSQC